jgi:hypothetical protein
MFQNIYFVLMVKQRIIKAHLNEFIALLETFRFRNNGTR